jgi:hypothetical protein
MGIRIGAALAAAALLAGCGAVEQAAGPPPTPEAILRDFGYTVRVPPSTLHGPGSLVFRRNAPGIGPGKVALGDICSPATMTFPDTLTRSSAETIGFGRDADFSFDARTLELLGLAASAGAIESLDLRFTNTEVLEYSLEDLEAIRDALGPKCARLLARQVELGNAWQVAGVFKADLAYSIAYRAEASAAARSSALRELTGRFGLAFEGAEATVGQGLYYGLFLCDAADCALARPDAAPPA